MTEERFSFTSGAKKTLMITGIVGFVLLILGVIMNMNSGHGHGDAHGGEEHAALHQVADDLVASAEAPQEPAGEHAAEEAHGEDGGHHETAPWLKNIYNNLWVNNVYFTGLAIIGLFFVAIQYAAQAGWSAGMKRIPLAMAHWLPYAGILMLISWFFVKSDVFHWTHSDLYHGDHADEILIGKSALWFWPLSAGSFPLFYILRMIVFFALWYMFFIWIKREMLAEDIDGDVKHWYKARKYSAIFLVIFAVSSSVSAWDWIMSVDPHWFSTMFGWYVFASWWVNGLAVITLIVVVLKQNGYLKVVNSNHLHDIGKFIFGFSIFWTYIWFSQFLLIYYANIPEETIYFIERLDSSQYKWVFFLNLLLNFLLPFLLLMTRDAKRHMSLLKLVCPIIIVGHWFDFYLMITPGVMQENGSFGFTEIGMLMIFGVAFLFVTLSNLAKAPLYAKNHPMLEESLHHHI
ncbi:quinol:cytochrome C oxidoreductase [Fulvivirga kasyanovii]|uniref:Quinol:cytochrome C oxidoreductase n=1 Tax=Fulvivirga kasyanovii TaxID=396812 RepID=A0ABW9RW48_9BACT|nr:quinol:cytochrome C oxidoreductase [Fulvivirga kasyanovii]MTI27453.1 quinol:cytochrome C oxidoreductase [Fulvivirga kasyanovii]